MTPAKKVVLLVNGDPRELVEAVRSFALDGLEFSFKAWEAKVKFTTLEKARSMEAKIKQHTGLHASIRP